MPTESMRFPYNQPVPKLRRFRFIICWHRWALTPSIWVNTRTFECFGLALGPIDLTLLRHLPNTWFPYLPERVMKEHADV